MRWFLLVALAFSACSAGPAMHQPPRVAIEGSHQLLLDVVRYFVSREGWEIVRMDPVIGLVEALTPEDQAVGVGMRRRWEFYISENQLSAIAMLEAKFEPTGDWKRADHVCSSYAYLQEKAVLREIAEMLATSRRKRPAEPRAWSARSK